MEENTDLSGLSSLFEDAGVAQPPPQPPAGAAPRQVTPEQLKKWTCLYNLYFDPAVSMAKGRRLPLSKLAGCELPLGLWVGCPEP